MQFLSRRQALTKLAVNKYDNRPSPCERAMDYQSRRSLSGSFFVLRSYFLIPVFAATYLSCYVVVGLNGWD
jgi:hypothetical protein